MDTIWINVILTGIIAFFTFANVVCSLQMAKLAKEQYRTQKSVYVFNKDESLYRIVRVGDITGFKGAHKQEKLGGFYLYLHGETSFNFIIKFRNEKDTPEKYFFDIVSGDISKIYRAV
jgi:hypothetical protein